MSKLRQLRYFRYQPAAGGIFGDLLKGGIKLVGKLFKKKGTPAAVAPAGTGFGTPINPYGELPTVGVNPYAQALTRGYGSRRGKGITARELRGFHKVSRLLHKEGMVSKKARRG
jgi:hypothetical protein